MKHTKIELLIGLMLMVSLSTQVFAIESGRVKKEIVIKGNFGSADGAFGHKIFEDRSWVEPSAIAIDSKGNIYIADPLNQRVQKFSSEGKYLTKITFEDQDKTFSFTICDLAIDGEDNLYILSKRGKKILKYDSTGRMTRSINLQDYMLPERFDIDLLGNIYVFGTVLAKVPGRGYVSHGNCLRKYDKTGRLVKEWNDVSLPFIDQEGYIYLRQESTWKKYDKNEKYLSVVKCETEKQKIYIENTCCFPPVFVDERKSSYYFVYDNKTEKIRSLFKLSSKAELKTYDFSSVDIWPWPRAKAENMIKFDKKGNLYGYSYDDIKREFGIIRLRFE